MIRKKKKKKKEGDSEKKKGGGGGKIHPFHLPWIRAWKENLDFNAVRTVSR